MSLKALITASLIVGTSSVALARPAPAPARHETPIVRDHRAEPVRVERDRREPVRVERERRVEPVRVERERFEHERRPIFTRPIVRERFERAPAYRYEIAPISMTTPFVQGQLVIGLGGAAGSGIELAANGGSTYVSQVAIRYLDGRTQLVQVNQYLDANNPALDLATDGSAVGSVIIYGGGAAVSAYAV